MEYSLVGWADEGPQLRLDHREFSYAGKFVMSNTGKAVAHEESEDGEGRWDTADGSVETREYDESLVAAIAFNEDRTDPTTAWLRYVTVRKSRRGEGVGARLARFAADRLRDRGYERVQIAVNNPFAFQALYKAGFGFTGEETGLAELVLAHPSDRSPERHRAGLDAYREREDLAPEEREFLDAKANADPPDVVAVPE